MKTDTIVAIATSLHSAGIGIIRISGEDAMEIIDKIYCSNNETKRLSNQKSHTIHYGFIVENNEKVDEVMVSIMRAPASYTKEDTVEINCHGGVFVMQKVLETVLRAGARLAEPGEFTKRAFLNGRIDLSEAEAVIDVIEAKNDYALKNSLSQLSGQVLVEIRSLREKILYEIAFIESALDDPEHISLEGYSDRLKEVVLKLLQEMELLLENGRKGRILKEGIRTLLIGKPNAGKSSILNLLLKQERAIVTEIAGTTRDVLEEELSLGGFHLNLIDTAGIRETENQIEQIGVEKTRKMLKTAELVLYVVDSSVDLDENDAEIRKLIQGKKSIALLNKQDLKSKVFLSDFKEEFMAVIPVSAKENTGMEELENCLRKLFFTKEFLGEENVMLTNIRHMDALEESIESLKLVVKSIEDGMPEDFFSIDLMNSYEALGRIIGESVGEDLVNEIFSRFCMGK